MISKGFELWFQKRKCNTLIYNNIYINVFFNIIK